MVIQDGIHVALLTPLMSSDEVDYEVLDWLLDRAERAGLQGVSILGSTGEGPSLGDAARADIQQYVVKALNKRMPVSVGVMESSWSRACRAVDQAHDLGIDAVLLGPPYYYPLNDQEVHRFFLRMADRTPLPIILYNIPQYTKVSLAPEVVHVLADHPMVIGIKDSSRDFGYFQRLIDATRTKDFKVFTGSDDMLLATHAVGGHGTICASANLMGNQGVLLWSALQTGDMVRAHSLQKDIMRLTELCRNLGGARAWRAALNLLGPRQTVPAVPLEAIGAQGVEELRTLLTDLHMLA